jgi:hypothetical protein
MSRKLNKITFQRDLKKKEVPERLYDNGSVQNTSVSIVRPT